MSYRLIIRAQAEADITDAAIWYNARQTGLGHRFLAEIQAAIQAAAANPRQHRRLRRRPEVRRVLTKHFPYRIFFVLRPDAIVVFRVLHTARHDRQWKTALLRIEGSTPFTARRMVGTRALRLVHSSEENPRLGEKTVGQKDMSNQCPPRLKLAFVSDHKSTGLSSPASSRTETHPLLRCKISWQN